MTCLYEPTASESTTVLARDDLVLLTSAPRARLDDLWRAVDDGADAARLLDTLTAGGISSTPDFVLVSGLGSSTSVVMARGALSAAVTTEDGPQHVEGAGVSSWVELRVENVIGLTLGSSTQGPLLPLVRGCAHGSAVHWGVPSRSSETTPAGLTAAENPGREESAHQPAPVPVVEAAPAGKQAVVDDPDPVLDPVPDPDATLGAAAATIVPTPESGDPAPSGGAYDHLFGATVMRSVEEAAVREEEPGADGDVSDRTVVVEDIAALRAQRRAERGKPPATPASPRFVVELPSGAIEPLDQSIIVGRAPSASRVSGAAVPRLVTITTQNQDISRSHVQIAVEGDSVVVTDLHSMNGTLVTVPGRSPVRLREGEPTTVLTGTIVDLGDGATLSVKEV